jgi:hypothetical protein
MKIPSPWYSVPQIKTGNARAGGRFIANMPAVWPVRMTGKMGSIQAGVIFAARRWCLFVKRMQYMYAAKQYDTAAYIQNHTQRQILSVLPILGFPYTCAPWIIALRLINTVELKYASESLVMLCWNTQCLVAIRLQMKRIKVTNSATPIR